MVAGLVAVVSGDRGFTVALVGVAVVVGLAASGVLIQYLGLALSLVAGALIGLATGLLGWRLLERSGEEP